MSPCSRSPSCGQVLGLDEYRPTGAPTLSACASPEAPVGPKGACAPVGVVGCATEGGLFVSDGHGGCTPVPGEVGFASSREEIGETSAEPTNLADSVAERGARLDEHRQPPLDGNAEIPEGRQLARIVGREVHRIRCRVSGSRMRRARKSTNTR